MADGNYSGQRASPLLPVVRMHSIQGSLLISVFAATPSLAGGDAPGVVELKCMEIDVNRTSTVLVERPAKEDWKICLLHSIPTDGLDAGSIVVTVRDTRLPDDSPHVLQTTIISFLPNADEVQAESCIDFSLSNHDVLAAVQSAGRVTGRTVRVCSLRGP